MATQPRRAVTIITAAMTITTTPTMITADPDRWLVTLAAWMSPAFPIGAFAYSHGLEWAVEDGLVTDAESLRRWAEHLIRFGAPRQDSVLLARAWRKRDDDAALIETARLAAALKGTAELAQETVVQGESFLRTVRAAWPAPRLDAIAALLQSHQVSLALPVAVGVSAAAHGIQPAPTLRFFLHAIVANTVSAAIRLSLIGQTDGQRVTAALEQTVLDATEAAIAADPDDVGTAAPMVDWCSMRHETQHTRLFRS